MKSIFFLGWIVEKGKPQEVKRQGHRIGWKSKTNAKIKIGFPKTKTLGMRKMMVRKNKKTKTKKVTVVEKGYKTLT